MHTRLVVITGGSGVGKSTLARALQERLLPAQWLHFSVDTLFYCLPRSITQRVDQLNDHALVDSRRVVAAAHACVAVLLGQGHGVIFDAVVTSQAGADRLVDAFGGFQPLFIELTCAWDVIAQRTLQRGDRTLEEAAHGYRHGRGHIQAHLAFDTSAVSPDELALQIARHLGNGPGAA